MRRTVLRLLGLSIFYPLLLAHADEGMWEPYQLPQLRDTLLKLGLQIDPNKLSSLDSFPMNAIVSLGGCSASFVSPRGLVVTNHHCVYGSVQYNSSTDNNLLQDGFLANQPSEELRIPPQTVPRSPIPRPS